MSYFYSKMDDGVRLKLNPEKTEFTVIGERQVKESLMQKFPTQFLGNSISPTNEVKNLGVTLVILETPLPVI